MQSEDNVWFVFLFQAVHFFIKQLFCSCNQTPPNVLTWVAMAKYFACLQQCPQMTLLDLSQCLANAQILTQVGNGDQPYWFGSPNILVIPAHRRKRINVNGFMQLAKIVPCFFFPEISKKTNCGLHKHDFLQPKALQTKKCSIRNT